MNKGKFKCDSCYFVSTRRWNVNRHIEAAHDGKAKVFNDQSDFPSSQRNPSFSPMNKETIPFWYTSEIRATKKEFDIIELLLKLEYKKEEKH
jgi:hypothetical protein